MNLGSHRREFLILGVALIISVSLIVGLPFYLSGHISVTGENPEPELTDGVTCESTELSYPFVNTSRGETGHIISVKMIFQSDELDSLGFYYDTYYSDDEDLRTAFDTINASLNTSLSNAGLISGQDLNVYFYKGVDNVRVSLYVDSNNVIGKALLRFMMLEVEDGVSLEKSDFINGYESQGFSCVKALE